MNAEAVGAAVTELLKVIIDDNADEGTPSFEVAKVEVVRTVDPWANERIAVYARDENNHLHIYAMYSDGEGPFICDGSY